MRFIDFITIRHWLLKQTLFLLVYSPSSLFQFMLFIGLVQPRVVSKTLHHYSQHCFHIYQESLWCDIGRSLIVKPFVFSKINSLNYSVTPGMVLHLCVPGTESYLEGRSRSLLITSTFIVIIIVILPMTALQSSSKKSQTLFECSSLKYLTGTCSHDFK